MNDQFIQDNSEYKPTTPRGYKCTLIQSLYFISVEDHEPPRMEEMILIDKDGHWFVGKYNGSTFNGGYFNESQNRYISYEVKNVEYFAFVKNFKDL